MRPPSRDTDDMLLFAIRDGMEKDIAYTKGWIGETVYKSPPDFPLDNKLRARVGAVLLGDTGLLDLTTASNLDKALQHYLGRTLEQQLKRHQNEMKYHRSFLNSLYLVNEAGRERFLLPRFEPQNAAEKEWMPLAEKQAEAAYKQARPNAEIVWINADSMASADGAIHCTTHVVPEWEHLPPYKDKRPGNEE